MAYCAPHGIPYSVFMGRVVAPGEPEWTDEDTALAVEWQRIQDTTCAGCGQPLAECLTDDGGYETAVVRCHGCKAKEKRAEELGKLSDTAGVKVVVHRLPEDA